MSTIFSTMDCPKCASVTNLVDSRYIGNSVQRWRKCPNCNHKFTTYEIPGEQIENASEYLKK